MDAYLGNSEKTDYERELEKQGAGGPCKNSI